MEEVEATAWWPWRRWSYGGGGAMEEEVWPWRRGGGYGGG